MYKGQRKLSVLLAEYSGNVLKPDSPDLKPFERVLCDLGKGKDSCWLVDNYSIMSNGYPRFRDDATGKMTVIQRNVWELCNGSVIPDDRVIVRTCGNARCVNPDHLELCDKHRVQELMRRVRMVQERYREFKEECARNPEMRTWLLSPAVPKTA